MSNEISTNMRVWEAVEATDPKFTKKFDNGSFKGTDINPTYRAKKMTEVSGPYGLGWGFEDVSFREIPTHNEGEVLVICQLKLWWIDSVTSVKGVCGPHTGCDYLIRLTAKSGLRLDTEVYKKVQTDAMTSAFRFLGISADVYMGHFDNSKYIQYMDEKFKDDVPVPVNGWSIEAKSEFAELMDWVYVAFRDAGKPEDFPDESEKWKQRMKEDPADKVLSSLRVYAQKLREKSQKIEPLPKTA
jgi:hypothetical protein